MATGMGMATRGPALNPDFGASLGRGTGEQTGSDRAVANGPMLGGGMKMGDKMDPKMKMGNGKDPHAGHGGAGKKVPGFPQSMGGMEMYSEKEVKKLEGRWQTRGMRKGWFEGVEGLMTVVRVLPPKLYDRVVSGKGEVLPGESVPGAKPGGMPGMDHGKHKKP